MLCSLNDLKVYKEYYENILNGNIVSFEDELIMKLKCHKNKDDKTMKSFLNTILSYGNQGTSYLKCRYLMQFMNSNYKLCDGYLNSFDSTLFHSWIESEDKVYDTLFVGIWPKELFYEVMNPKITKVVDTTNDKEYLRIKEKTIETKVDDSYFGYVDWYNYMKNNTINTRGFSHPLRLKKFENE